MSEHDILTFDYSAPYEDGQRVTRRAALVAEFELRTRHSYEAADVEAIVAEIEAIDEHRDDGQCHEECWRRAVAEHEAAEAARFGDPEHTCGPYPYLFAGDCPACEAAMDRA
jgi:hypothetical protein